MELTRQFPAQVYARALESWTWLGVGGKVPLFTSPFGDVCLRDEAGFWWLSLLDGTLELVWQSADQLRAELDSEDGQDLYLLGTLAWAAEQRGIVPTHEQVYAFAVPPVLGGPIGVDHIQVIDFVAIMSFTGQLHEQIRDLPQGAPVSGLTVSDSGAVQLNRHTDGAGGS
ncbi:DUF1851 domain-containing protein [Dactylosporangium sp. AC04546]|uniref:DUF1851 domain-containing protein n=1 Tax=Dactylosporangium sp. AC04546 TaxID=2862460 RepID=UPI001EE11A42|nr:DUF1851 domain-containing protein [Dactylosporangium sp. AC04546]WVK87035.1 DUF1851 domain-containing protein [Dactylosporangium sp. AC04546]